ncbi:hypothetical protein A4X06_0g5298 [Tilletia controversa]|uniref:Uncharacterized protein n=1 Tax=Tilletia controversa TaxID=13291 RepID=A0A8X7MS06_9BASI|nr:hypothetical protein A4X06_0g5298 [Tilletia controversa]
MKSTLNLLALLFLLTPRPTLQDFHNYAVPHLAMYTRSQPRLRTTPHVSASLGFAVETLHFYRPSLSSAPLCPAPPSPAALT